MRLLVVVAIAASACDYSGKHRCTTSGDCNSGRLCADGQCAAPDSVCSVAKCALYSVEPALAESGDTLSVEGTFGPDLTLSFPGGVSAQPTAVELHRAWVIVPAGATAGDLFATTNGRQLGPLPFRQASFPLSVSATLARPTQLDHARRPLSVTPRTGVCAIATSRYVYLIGDLIERARVEADGALSSLTAGDAVTLEPRAGAACVVAGSTVYLAGPSNTVEKAPILDDGTLGPFARFGTMSRPRDGAAAAVVGNALYVLGPDASVEKAPLESGEFVASAPLVAPHAGAAATVTSDWLYLFGPSIERAPIAVGAVGAFALVPETSPLPMHAAAARLGHHLYLFGGEDAQGRSLDTMARVDLTDLTIDVQAGLSAARTRAAAVVTGDFVHLLGGDQSGEDLLAIDDGATLGGFLPAVDLDDARSNFSVVALGGWVYLVGGRRAGTAVAEVVRAPVAADGTIGAFALSSHSLTQPRWSTSLAVVDDTLYVLGGTDVNGNPLSTIDRAAVGADGDLGPFSLDPVSLDHGLDFSFAAVLGGSVDLFGGHEPGGTTGSIEAAPLGDSGLGAFTTLPTALVTARRAFSGLATGHALFFAGGNTAGGTLADVERVGYSSDGTLSPAVTQPTSLAEASAGAGGVVIGGRWWLLGGSQGMGFASNESSPIGLDGELGAFTPAPVTFTTPRTSFKVLALGNWVYAFGGLGPGLVPLATSERAPIVAAP